MDSENPSDDRGWDEYIRKLPIKKRDGAVIQRLAGILVNIRTEVGSGSDSGSYSQASATQDEEEDEEEHRWTDLTLFSVPANQSASTTKNESASPAFEVFACQQIQQSQSQSQSQNQPHNPEMRVLGTAIQIPHQEFSSTSSSNMCTSYIDRRTAAGNFVSQEMTEIEEVQNQPKGVILALAAPPWSEEPGSFGKMK